MACRSDYLEPTPAENKARHTAQLILWLTDPGRSGKVLTKSNQRQFEAQANQSYAIDVGQAKALCTLVNELRTSPDAFDEYNLFDIIIQENVKDPRARQLADWADDHDKQDRVNARVEVQRARQDDEDVITKALKELSSESLSKLKEIFANLK